MQSVQMLVTGINGCPSMPKSTHQPHTSNPGASPWSQLSNSTSCSDWNTFAREQQKGSKRSCKYRMGSDAKKVGHSHKPRNTPNVWFVEGLEDLPKPLQKAEEGTTATIRFCIAEIVEIVGR